MSKPKSKGLNDYALRFMLRINPNSMKDRTKETSTVSNYDMVLTTEDSIMWHKYIVYSIQHPTPDFKEF